MTKSWMLAGVLAACASRPVEMYREPVTVHSAQLVPLDPDVSVVSDADEPMVFTAGSFWLFHDAGWYRAASVRGPWTRDGNPPWQVKKVDQPYALVHYDRNHDHAQAKAEIVPEKQKRKNQMFDF